MRELKYVEHSRSKAKGQLVDTFKSHKFALEDQKRQVTKKLASFAKPELKGLQMDSNVVEECIKGNYFRAIPMNRKSFFILELVHKLLKYFCSSKLWNEH